MRAQMRRVVLGALAVASGCEAGPEIRVGGLALDLSACMGWEARGEGSCGAALRDLFEGDVPACVAFRTASDQAVGLWLDPETGEARPAGGRGDVDLGEATASVRVKVFYLAPAASAPGAACVPEAFRVDATCGETAGCLLATGVQEVEVGSGADATLTWGGPDGPPCAFECGDPAFCGRDGGPAAEVCDGRDNDCDGAVDEELDRDCGTNDGECVAGTQRCEGGVWAACHGEVGPGAETCNGLDDDCDGDTDERLGETTCGLGACRHTVDNCVGGDPQRCDELEGQQLETCNLADDDCDGVVDNELVDDGRGCATGRGECRGAQGWVDPAANYDPAAEACSGLDDDCDGDVDEDYVCCEAGPVNPQAPPEEQWVQVCPGTFDMGSPEGEPGQDDDEPQHHVALTGPYVVQATEVTVGQYRACHAAGWCRAPSDASGYCNGLEEAGEGQDPINCVSWTDAIAYLTWLSVSVGEGLEACYLDPDDESAYDGDDAEAGKVPDWPGLQDCTGYRLPTESEWEYAARAGTTGMFYNCDPPGGASPCDDSHMEGSCGANADLTEIAVYCQHDPGGTAPVASKGPAGANPWGLHDMLGNVYEWTWDRYDGNYGLDAGQLADTETDPLGDEAGGDRVFRGGSSSSYARYCRAAFRSRGDPGYRITDIGFRPARSVFP